MSTQRVIIAGGSGLIGGALTQSLRSSGVTVVHLIRRPSRSAHEVEWLTDNRPLDPGVLADADAVVCLNGASIGRLPWTRGYQQQLRTSRLVPTRTLATALHELGSAAPAFLCASAVGYYGNRPGEELTGQSRAGQGFLADLCQEWEDAAAVAPSRVVHLRTAIVLHQRSVLKPLMLLTRLGLSGRIGPGSQIWPWISLDDEVRALRFLIDSDISGAVNLTGPSFASASDIGKELARQMRRPFLVPAPAIALRFGLGRDAAESLMLADARVKPVVLEQAGFTFRHSTAEQAITAALQEQNQ